MRIGFNWMLFGLAALAILPRNAAAQDYPSHTVTVLVPFAAGGGTDLLARAVAQRLEQRLGKPFVIENRTGAGDRGRRRRAAKAAPDGYTLMQATSGTMAMIGAMFKNLPLRSGQGSVPVALVAAVPFVLAVNCIGAGAQRRGSREARQEKPLNYGSAGPARFIT